MDLIMLTALACFGKKPTARVLAEALTSSGREGSFREAQI